jgi:hypothetical protein
VVVVVAGATVVVVVAGATVVVVVAGAMVVVWAASDSEQAVTITARTTRSSILRFKGTS